MHTIIEMARGILKDLLDKDERMLKNEQRVPNGNDYNVTMEWVKRVHGRLPEMVDIEVCLLDMPRLLDHLVVESVAFIVEPQCDNMYLVAVKEEAKKVLLDWHAEHLRKNPING